MRGDAWLFVLFEPALGYGAFLFLLAAARRPTKLTVLLALVFVALPQLFLFPSIVWKDVLFANATIAGFCCLSLAVEDREARIKTRLLLLGAIVLLSLAVLARQNGVVILPCAALGFGLATGSRGRASSILGRSLLFALAVGVLAFAGHRLLQPRLGGAVIGAAGGRPADLRHGRNVEGSLTPASHTEQQAPAMARFRAARDANLHRRCRTRSLTCKCR